MHQSPLNQLAPVGKSFKDETRLALFALERQAVAGSCKEPKPWGWNVVESAKWQAWSQLQDMAPVEAMRLYVRLLEDELVSHCCGQFLLYATSFGEDSSASLALVSDCCNTSFMLTIEHQHCTHA